MLSESGLCEDQERDGIFINVDFMVNGFCPLEGEEFCSGSCLMPDFTVRCVETFFLSFQITGQLSDYVRCRCQDSA
jgi:hypothetical protein